MRKQNHLEVTKLNNTLAYRWVRNDATNIAKWEAKGYRRVRDTGAAKDTTAQVGEDWLVLMATPKLLRKHNIKKLRTKVEDRLS